MTSSNTISFPARDVFGSRFRCLLLTHQPGPVVAGLLNDLVRPHAVVEGGRDYWMPRGLLDPNESRLGEPEFLSDSNRKAIQTWWLAVSRNANTPNWDIVSTCTIDGQPGLVLVEAKAHVAELGSAGKSAPKSPNGWKNLERITIAMAEANRELNDVIPGFSLTVESHYQLCNRFAWSWKIASMGVPVILVYLGFLNADDMAERGQTTFKSDSEWDEAVRDYGSGIVPDEAWTKKLDIDGTPFIPIIRAMDGRWPAKGRGSRQDGR
ncbi:MAG: hypothetical protein J4O01_03980 [Chloroflexi bacterium]|nr:hypothetical protein [Chloroflexota bacterium]MCI0837695.1 hypothetical protein [Chloroflexota bacterium]MCI0851201.1 hypothetical protein [Chloroflexota bacterium]MCI0873710.1 hypothetical protein [Chloroflexota bacterium]